MVTRTANSAPLPYLASHATAEEVCPTWASSAAVTYACRSARPHGINRTTPTRRQLTGQLSRARPRPRRNSLNHAPNLTGRGCPGSPSKTFLGEPRRRLAITGPVPLPTLRQYPREQSAAWEPPGEDECHSRNRTQFTPHDAQRPLLPRGAAEVSAMIRSATRLQRSGPSGRFSTREARACADQFRVFFMVSRSSPSHVAPSWRIIATVAPSRGSPISTTRSPTSSGLSLRHVYVSGRFGQESGRGFWST